MFNFQSFTNVRPTKDLGCQIITAPTKGQIKVTPEAAKALEVSVGDYVQVGGVDGKLYVVKGSKEQGGGKIAASNKTGAGILTFSSAMTWEQLEGDENYNVHYDVDTENPVTHGDRTFFELTLAEKVEKQKRKSKADKTSEPLEEADAPVEEVENLSVESEEVVRDSPFDAM